MASPKVMEEQERQIDKLRMANSRMQWLVKAYREAGSSQRKQVFYEEFQLAYEDAKRAVSRYENAGP